MRDDSEHIEQIFRIEEMKTELEELSDGRMIMHSEDALPLEIEEQFLDHVLAFERAEVVTHKELLARDGVALPPPDELDDEALALKLIEVIHTLAAHRNFLENTNHFSDRELYTHLWEDVLNEWGPILPPDDPTNCHIDLVGSGSEPHVLLYLRYYADEDTRLQWAKDFTDMEVPPHEDPPYDRDRHLPTPPEPPNPYDDPAVLEAWWTECREKLARRLAADGIIHGAFGDEPLSYCPDFACVCAIDAPNQPGTVGWWAISGDVPTAYLPITDIPDPRAFLRTVSRRWHAAIEAMERGESPDDLPSSNPKDWPHIISLLRYRADILESWANDDSAWEDE